MRTLDFDQYQWSRETIEEQSASGRYTPAQVIVWKGHRYPIGAGTADDVDLFTEDGWLYVLSRHRGLGYAGLQVFRDGDLIADTFTDTEEQGGYLNELTAIYAAKRLADYCQT
jgi:hypothetical protein